MSATERDNYESSELEIFLEEAQLNRECLTGNEINEKCFDEFTEKVHEEYFDDFLGEENPFEVVLNVTSIENFQIESFTMSLIRTDRMIQRNISKFREDFKIRNFYRMENSDLEKCYVTISSLKPYWITSSSNNLIVRNLKFKLFDKVPNGILIWVRLK